MNGKNISCLKLYINSANLNRANRLKLCNFIVNS